jgi:hypothetical protein
MGKPIPYNPNTRKVPEPSSDVPQKEMRVVVVPPITAEANAEPDARNGSSLLKRIRRVQKVIPKGGNKR